MEGAVHSVYHACLFVFSDISIMVFRGMVLILILHVATIACFLILVGYVTKKARAK